MHRASADDRDHALRVLALPSTATPRDVKRAYRRLAREHHPDLGGDPELFHELQQAFEQLLDDETPPTVPTVIRGFPSRPAANPNEATEVVDLSMIDWSTTPRVGSRLDSHTTAVALAGSNRVPIGAVTATSRSPGSKLNGVARYLADHMTSTLWIGGTTDDRERAVAAIELRATQRRGRRALDRASLLGTWKRIRGSSTTLLTSQIAPDDDSAVTALRTVRRAEEMLDQLQWHWTEWTLTAIEE